MLHNVWNCPPEVAILKPKSCDSLALLFRSEQQRFGLIWSEPSLWRAMRLTEPISRKFIRENFIEFDDIDNILFNSKIFPRRSKIVVSFLIKFSFKRANFVFLFLINFN